MKRLSLLLLLVLTAAASAQPKAVKPHHANNILILIQPALAGPNVDPLNYWQPQWILWPPALDDSDGGRLLSIATGDNWVGNLGDFRFDAVEHGTAWQARDFQDMKARGRFLVRKEALGELRTDLLVGRTGSSSPNALRLALNADSPIVHPHRVSDKRWPAGSLMVAEASGWDEVAEFANSTTGRVLVVEYPPRSGVPWTRYWLKGGGWDIGGLALSTSSDSAVVARQPGSPVPGLIRARLLIPLVTHPERFDVAVVNLQNWPGANRFLEVCRSDGAFVGAVWMALAVGILVWSVVVVSNERTSLVLPILLSGLILSPAIIDLAGQMERTLGVEQWPVWIAVSCVSLASVSAAFGLLQKRFAPQTHPLLSVFAVGLATICAVNPIWSFMTPVFSARTSLASPIALGAILGYLAGCVASLRGGGTVWVWVGRLLCLSYLVGGLLLKAWWIDDLGASLFIPVVSLLVGEGFFRPAMLAGFVLWPSSVASVIAWGFIWAPLSLLKKGQDRAGVNLAAYIDFLMSPSLFVFILVAGGISIFGYRFFFHQIRMLGKLDRRRNALSAVAVSGAAFGVLQPTFLGSSLVLATGAMGTLLFDAVQTM